MSGVELLDQVVKLVDLGEPVLWLCFLIFLWMAAPRKIQRLYPFKVQMLWALPFSGRWREETAPEHLDRIRKFREGMFAFSIAILAVPLLEFVYYRYFFVSLHTLR